MPITPRKSSTKSVPEERQHGEEEGITIANGKIALEDEAGNIITTYVM